MRTALFSDDWVSLAIARLYESLMKDTLIEARAFFDLAKAAEWLAIPVNVLRLKDKPAPQLDATSQASSGTDLNI